MRLIVFCEKSFDLKKGLENIGFSDNSNLIECHSFSNEINVPLFVNSEKRKRIKHLIESESKFDSRIITPLPDYEFQTWNFVHENEEDE